MTTASYLEVRPIIIYPPCLKAGRTQDCFACALYRSGTCPSPRGACVKCYRNHRRGCPNYGKRKDCPPSVPMFDQVFDVSKPVYAIYSIFDLAEHVERMRARRPDWTEPQLLNSWFWQPTANRLLNKRITEFISIYRNAGYYATTGPEAMGIDVTETMRNAGIELEWPVRKQVYKIAFAGILLDDRHKFEISGTNCRIRKKE